MTFMIIESFREGAEAVRARFVKYGRLMPEGVRYVASWVEPNGSRCFQVVEADDTAQVKEWTDRWADLIDFEILPVLTSQEFWQRFETGRA
jgi:hypothetical protein